VQGGSLSLKTANDKLSRAGLLKIFNQRRFDVLSIRAPFFMPPIFVSTIDLYSFA
jgi:hypothetical protein